MGGSARRTGPPRAQRICFDAKRRQEFIEGFAKRKAQRRQAAQEQEARREKEERRRLKRQRQELLMKHVADLEEARRNARIAHARASMANHEEDSPEPVSGDASSPGGKKRKVTSKEVSKRPKRGSEERESEPSEPRSNLVQKASRECQPAGSLDGERSRQSVIDRGRHRDLEEACADSPFQSVVRYVRVSPSQGARRLSSDGADSDKTTHGAAVSSARAENMSPWLLGCTVTTSFGSFLQPPVNAPAQTPAAGACPSSPLAKTEGTKGRASARSSASASPSETRQSRLASRGRTREDSLSVSWSQGGSLAGTARGSKEGRARTPVKKAAGKKAKGGRPPMRSRKGKGKKGKKRGQGRK